MAAGEISAYFARHEDEGLLNSQECLSGLSVVDHALSLVIHIVYHSFVVPIAFDGLLGSLPRVLQVL